MMVRSNRPFDDVSIDRVRDYWDSRPCNIRHSDKPLGTREYFDEVETRKYLVEAHITKFVDFKRWKGKNVLEIGCGIGTDTISFARNGAQVTAVELSQRSLELTEDRARVYGLAGNVHLHLGDAEKLTQVVPSQHYDLIYSFGVIHHTPDPELALKEIAKVASPGSMLKLMVYYRYSWKVAAIVLRHGKGRVWRLRTLVAEHSEAQTGSPITYTYSRKELQGLLERNGFRVEQIFVDHIFPYKIPDYVEHRYVKTWYFRAIPRQAFRWLERHFGWHLCVTAVRDVGSA